MRARLRIPRWLLVAAVACGVDARAYAHDAPQVREIVFRPGGRVVLSTNRGLVFGDGARGPWRLMCNEALGISTSELPSIGYDAQGLLFAATSSGLQWSPDEGCNWRGEPAFDGLLVPALAVSPDDADTLYLATFPVGEASSRVSGDSAIWVSRDGGGSYEDLQVVPDDDYIHSLRVAPSAPDHIYAAGAVYDMGRAFYVMRSRDAGASWERFPVDIAEDEVDLVLLAVSPTDPQVVLARAVAGEPSVTAERLLLSRDGGTSFTSVARVMTLRDAAFSHDGQTVWLAGREGLFRSRGTLSSFERVGVAEDMTCVMAHEGALYACGRFADTDAGPVANGVGVSHDGGESFAPWMRFEDVVGPIACDQGATTTPVCIEPWDDWQSEQAILLGEPVSNTGPDAGPSSAATLRSDAGPAPTADADAAPDVTADGRHTEAGGTGCAVTRPGRGAAGAAWLGLGLLLWALARRRPRAPRTLGAWLFVLLGCAGAEAESADDRGAGRDTGGVAGSPAAGASLPSTGGTAPPPAGQAGLPGSGGEASTGGASQATAPVDGGGPAPDGGVPASSAPRADASAEASPMAGPSYPILELDQVGAPRQLATGFTLAESPLWDPCEQRLLFTDVRGGGGGGVIHTATEDGAVGVLVEDTGNANGIAFDIDGSLILAQMGGSPGHVARLSGGVIEALEPPGSPTLHTPDDVIVRSDGTIYFSDGDFYPIGTLLGFARQLPVYALTPGADVLVEIGRVSGPNGIELSPDERTLFVSAYGAGEVVPFDVAADGSLARGPALIRGLDNSDSLCLDAAGNLYVGVRQGLHVARPDGQEVGLIPIPGGTSTTGTTSCGFGGEDGTTLFITSWTSLYVVDDMPIPGQDFLANRARLGCR